MRRALSLLCVLTFLAVISCTGADIQGDIEGVSVVKIDGALFSSTFLSEGSFVLTGVPGCAEAPVDGGYLTLRVPDSVGTLPILHEVKVSIEKAPTNDSSYGAAHDFRVRRTDGELVMEEQAEDLATCSAPLDLDDFVVPGATLTPADSTYVSVPPAEESLEPWLTLEDDTGEISGFCGPEMDAYYDDEDTLDRLGLFVYVPDEAYGVVYYHLLPIVVDADTDVEDGDEHLEFAGEATALTQALSEREMHVRFKVEGDVAHAGSIVLGEDHESCPWETGG